MKRRRARELRNTYALDGDELDAKIDAATFAASPLNADVWKPTPSQVIPKGGAWAMIVRELPPMERQLQTLVTPGRAFWVEHNGGADEFGFLPDGSYKALCRSPFGELSLWPYEYAVVEPAFLIGAWQAGEFVFHPLADGEKQFSNALFYALSRGIERADAVVMALGTMAGPVGWFEPREDLAREAEAMARAFANVGILTDENRARRRAAQRRKRQR